MFAQTLFRQAGLAIFALAWLWLGSLAATSQPADYPDEDLQSSFSELDRYGRWIEHREWGTVWVPDVDDDWRPYTVGRWAYTDENGWYWDSDEPFGWAVFHYGRWIDDPDEGWIWIPGTEWAPAWVAWRYGEDAVGWAPLPPRAIWYPDRGLDLDDEFYHGSFYEPFWIFVAPRYLLSPGLHRYAIPRGRNAAFFAHTRPATRYGWEGRRIFNHGIARHEVERLTRTRVPSLALMPSSRPPAGRRAASGAVLSYRPAIVPSSRWQSGRSGDWRRFEPAARPPIARPPAARPAPVRGDRDYAPRRESVPSFPSRDRDVRRGDGGSRMQLPQAERTAPRDSGQDHLQRPYRERNAPADRRSYEAPQAVPRVFRPEPEPRARQSEPRTHEGGRMQRPEFAPPPRQQREAAPPQHQRQAPAESRRQHQPPPQRKPDEAPAPQPGGGQGGGHGGSRRG